MNGDVIDNQDGYMADYQKANKTGGESSLDNDQNQTEDQNPASFGGIQSVGHISGGVVALGPEAKATANYFGLTVEEVADLVILLKREEKPDPRLRNLIQVTLLRLYYGLITAYTVESLARQVNNELNKRVKYNDSDTIHSLAYMLIRLSAEEGWLAEFVQVVFDDHKENEDFKMVYSIQPTFREIPDFHPFLAKLHHLHYVIKRADDFMAKDVYVDLAVTADLLEPASKGYSEATRLVLERQHIAFQEGLGLKDNPYKAQTIDSFDDLYAHIIKEKRVALIGDPGSGKTTTIMHLARKMALGAIKESHMPLPLIIPLKTFRSDNFDDLLTVPLSKSGLNPQEYLPDRVFLLLDGINEMPGGYEVSLRSWLEWNSDLAIVVTCRKLDYLKFQLPLNRVDIEPLKVESIYDFLSGYLPDGVGKELFWQLSGKNTAEAWAWWQNEWSWLNRTKANQKNENVFTQFWHGNIGKADAWEKNRFHLKQVQDSLRNTGRLPGLLGIAANPFFLTAIVEIKLKEEVLFQNRGQLLAKFITTQLKQSQKASSQQGPISLIKKPVDDMSQDYKALALLAYQMQFERVGTVVDVTWIVNTLTNHAANYDVEKFLNRMVKSHILDVVPGETVSFTHQLIQEFFAASKLGEEIERGAKAVDYWPGNEWWKPTGWEESIVLWTGLAENPNQVVQWLTPIQPVLAYRCAMENKERIAAKIMQDLYEPQHGVRVAPEALLDWGKKLAAEGDGRKGVGLDENGVPDLDWIPVPEGEFLFGFGERHKLPAFKIARYPITVMQFQAFIDASEGFHNQEWWNGLLDTPPHIGRVSFNYANHPRDNVSWYDAIAFCRWLSFKLDRVITLPTELQWEKAARGSDGLIWPWGEKYLVGYANVDERDDHNPVGLTYLRSTTAVGLYPWGQSPYGVMDMCGNVWEWCLNDAQDMYGESMGEPTAEKQLRGGSWNNNIDVAPTYHRYTSWVNRPLLPNYRNWRVGFRVVMLE